MACNCTSVFTALSPSPFIGVHLVAAQHCGIAVTVLGQIEIATKLVPTSNIFVPVCELYSIGNQVVSGSISIDCSKCMGCSGDSSDDNSSGDCCNTCHSPQLIINGQSSPASVCDGEILVIQVNCGGYVLGNSQVHSSDIRCCIGGSLTLNMQSIATVKNNVIKINPNKLLRYIRRNRDVRVR